MRTSPNFEGEKMSLGYQNLDVMYAKEVQSSLGFDSKGQREFEMIIIKKYFN
jgi:hypothetical protein